MFLERELINKCLDGFSVPHCRRQIEKEHTNPEDLSRQKERRSRKLRRLAGSVVRTLGLDLVHHEDMDTLGELTPDWVIHVLPPGRFSDRRHYDLVVLHELSHALCVLLGSKPALAKWCRNHVGGAKAATSAQKLEEIVVELAAIKVVAGMDEPEETFFEPSFYYIRRQLADLSRFGVSWKEYPCVMEYGLKKGNALADILLEIGLNPERVSV